MALWLGWGSADLARLRLLRQLSLTCLSSSLGSRTGWGTCLMTEAPEGEQNILSLLGPGQLALAKAYHKDNLKVEGREKVPHSWPDHSKGADR